MVIFNFSFECLGHGNIGNIVMLRNVINEVFFLILHLVGNVSNMVIFNFSL